MVQATMATKLLRIGIKNYLVLSLMLTSDRIINKALSMVEIEDPDKSLQTTLKNNHFIVLMLSTHILLKIQI